MIFNDKNINHTLLYSQSKQTSTDLTTNESNLLTTTFWSDLFLDKESLIHRFVDIEPIDTFWYLIQQSVIIESIIEST